jgi:sugar (pentulose or hexulose) kinase
VIEWSELEPGLFCELRQAGASWGRIMDVRHPGLERLVGATVTVAGHDHLAAAVGSGITGSDQIMDSCGTAEALLRAIGRDQSLDPLIDIPEGIAIGWHVLPDCYCLLAGIPLGIELTQILAQLGASQSRGETSLDEGALQILESELTRADATDPMPADASDPARVWLRSLQRAAARAAERRAELERLGGPVTAVRISGGWAQNPVLSRVKELDFAALVYPAVVEAGVRGSALMAGLAAGIFDSVESFPAPPERGEDLDASTPSDRLLTTQPEVH